MKIKYQWKEISDDGLLKEVEYREGYYKTLLNGWNDGYDCEEEAVKALKEALVSASSRFDIPRELTLIKVYMPREEL